MANYRCVVFDFDGTIADSSAQALEVLNELSRIFKFKTINPEEGLLITNMSTLEVLDYLDIPKLKLPSIVIQGRKLFSKRMADIQPVPNIEKVLIDLKKQVETLGILTTNSPENVREFLKRQHLEIFDFISSGRKLMGKSSNIKSILKTFSLKPSDFLYIGDESRDIVAARKAGVNVAAVTWGLNTQDVLKKENPTHLINTPDELIEIVNNP